MCEWAMRRCMRGPRDEVWMVHAMKYEWSIQGCMSAWSTRRCENKKIELKPSLSTWGSMSRPHWDVGVGHTGMCEWVTRGCVSSPHGDVLSGPHEEVSVCHTVTYELVVTNCVCHTGMYDFKICFTHGDVWVGRTGMCECVTRGCMIGTHGDARVGHSIIVHYETTSSCQSCGTHQLMVDALK